MITEEAARKRLETLHQDGSALAKALTEDEEMPFEDGYQCWYSKALPLIKSLALDRYTEFQSYYLVDPKYGWYNSGAFVIQDYFRGRDMLDENFDARGEAVRCFRHQLAILKSVAARLAWGQLDTDEQAERGLQLAFLETARNLMGVDARAAGALAGVVLENWLKKLCAKYRLKFRKQAPPLRDYMDALHGVQVLDIPVHAQAIWLAEIAGRATAEGESPTKLQVRDLIDGSRWLITNIF